MRVRGCLRLAGLRPGILLLDIDCALKESAILNHNALRAHVANQRAGLAQLHATGGGHVAFNPAMHDQIASGDARFDLSVRTDDQAVVPQIDSALNLTIQIQVFTAGKFAFNLD